ncbi:hypothetical protein AJ85_11990 [Alkalihalobacillus alcalophilus ATCC 27647 = CGMCC 1.3604]|uniref:Cytosolic protein n=1 Tax=Alkalihalobacillus alcalophilus ATCC 27647 = CGMCC 1.3604 TaxID=1218173 RepID=A0A094XGF6_ALKAL|nr:hypothetical protein [Alkalihalobacillus alcalophilus]KGA97840.1 hypothetical protein BALCAV_0207930 [Alkalihalobacillus alcalophilus ATCC 27647 = CGMCC 1.3604]MED1563883.1 DUF1499 domain-containing protein [Alkalihalobacillus alcalophilus]THG90243.1 hypothetical protein AJ85_11990 [Alkalihalobacillus alcalophilus ATCC 27647 = CGMCC 1.3604]
MGFRDVIVFISSNRTETREAHQNDQLKTRYYKGSKEKVMEAVEHLIKKNGFHVKRAELERGEIIGQQQKGTKQLIIATVITVRPFKTAVDFSISTDSLLPTDFGKSKKQVISFYEQLDKTLTFIGTGIGDELL